MCELNSGYNILTLPLQVQRGEKNGTPMIGKRSSIVPIKVTAVTPAAEDSESSTP